MEILTASSEYYLYVLFFVGLLSGLIGAMGGSGGLIVTPFMLLSGMPAITALASMRLASVGMWSAVVLRFKETEHIRWNHVPVLTLLCLLGGLIGTKVAIVVNEDVLSAITGASICFIVIVALFKKEFGLLERAVSKRRQYLGYFFYFLVMVLGGMVAGIGVLVMVTFIHFLGFKTLDAYATDLPAWLLFTIISSAIFMWEEVVDYTYALVLFLSMTLGGWVGAKIAIQKGHSFVKKVTLFFGFVMSIKLVWDGISVFIN